MTEGELKNLEGPDGETTRETRASPSRPQPERGSGRASRFLEQPPTPVVVPIQTLRAQTRRNFLLGGASAGLAAAGFWWLLPEEAQQRPLTDAQRAWLDSVEARAGISSTRSEARREAFLNRALTFDDDVAEALYSPGRMLPTYSKSQVTPNLRNNYNGATPDPSYLKGWTLTVSGLASGKTLRLTLHDLNRLQAQLRSHEQVTRLVCVEGWSAITWWEGLRFAEFLKVYPPAPQMRWARLDSAVNLDGDGKPDPYYVSIDLPTARHPQTLLAAMNNGKPLTPEHGAPLRLIAPMKLGLKNIKAITKITYTAQQPADYWNERGYSKYDGI